MTQKIVVNACFGGFSLSEMAVLKLGLKGSYSTIARDDALLVALVAAYGPAINGKHADLRVVEVPDGVEWEIEEYDGTEWIAEKHRCWYPAGDMDWDDNEEEK